MIGITIKASSLLWRGSRDGFGAKTFHQLCDRKANTLTIIKNTEGRVFGGYASEAWSSPSKGMWKQDENSFIFTLKNPTNQPLKLEVVDARCALFHRSNLGPVFGNEDLKVADQSNTNQKSWMKFGNSGRFNFQTSEIEVFQTS